MKGGQTRNRSKTGQGMLTDEQVREIRKAKELYYANMPKNLSKTIGVSRSIISGIWQDRLYNHVI